MKLFPFAVAMLLTTTPVMAQNYTITDLDSPIPAGENWAALPGENTGTVAITTNAPRSGNGSLELTGDRTRAQTGVQYATATNTGATLDNVSSLTFDYRIASDSTRTDYTPALRLLVQDGLQRSELVWEGAYNLGSTPFTTDTWHTTTASDLFWQQIAGSGPNETGGSLQLMTIAEWAASLFYSSDAFVSGVSVGAGSGATLGYHAFVDNVTATGSFGERAFNFETADVSGAVPEPATWAMMLIGFGAMGVSMRRRRRTHTLLQAA